VENLPTAVGHVNLTFRTRYSDEGMEARVPREMWIDARGESENDLDEVLTEYGNAAFGFLPAIAFATNAAVSDPEIKIGFEATPVDSRRRYFQSFVPEATGIPYPGRHVLVEQTFHLIRAVNEHEEGERLRRAMEQYRVALGYWKRGLEVLSVAHLFMGVEALTPVALRRELARAGTDPEGLANSWGIEREDGRWRGLLDAEVRKRILFRGDQETYAKARRASDGFEHGFLDFNALRELSGDVQKRAAKYLRDAVFDLVELDDEVREPLTTHPYETPLNSFVVRYLRGTFLGDAEDLAAPDQEYPLFRWTSKLKTLSRTDNGGYHLEMDEQMTARFSDDVQFQPQSFEVWGPREALGMQPPSTKGLDQQGTTERTEQEDTP
jgi:hypothetical protein